MKMKMTYFWKGMLSLFLWIISLGIFAQNMTVRGTVTDAGGEPLAGVTVLIQGTTTGTVTDADGIFVLEGVSPEITLNVSYVGMQTQIIPVNGRTTINVILLDDTELLDELGEKPELRYEDTDIVITPNDDGSFYGKLDMGNAIKPYFGIGLGRTKM